MASGCASSVTSPLVPVTVTGQDACSDAALVAAASLFLALPPQPARTSSGGSSSAARACGERVERNTGSLLRRRQTIAHEPAPTAPLDARPLPRGSVTGRRAG